MENAKLSLVYFHAQCALYLRPQVSNRAEMEKTGRMGKTEEMAEMAPLVLRDHEELKVSLLDD